MPPPRAFFAVLWRGDVMDREKPSVLKFNVVDVTPPPMCGERVPGLSKG
jgi:hypothetical protein